MLGYKVIFDRGYINVEFDVRFSMLVLFDVTNVETFVVKFSTFVTSKFRHKSLSVIEAYDRIRWLLLSRKCLVLLDNFF